MSRRGFPTSSCQRVSLLAHRKEQPFLFFLETFCPLAARTGKDRLELREQLRQRFVTQKR